VWVGPGMVKRSLYITARAIDEGVDNGGEGN